MSVLLSERAAFRVAEAATDAVEYMHRGALEDAARVLASAADDLGRARQQLNEVIKARRGGAR